jgi:hypothetical protein
MDEKMNGNNRRHWLNKLRKLNPNRSRAKGAAPHKPCLVLSRTRTYSSPYPLEGAGKLQRLEGAKKLRVRERPNGSFTHPQFH